MEYYWNGVGIVLFYVMVEVYIDGLLIVWVVDYKWFCDIKDVFEIWYVNCCNFGGFEIIRDFMGNWVCFYVIFFKVWIIELYMVWWKVFIIYMEGMGEVLSLF